MLLSVYLLEKARRLKKRQEGKKAKNTLLKGVVNSQTCQKKVKNKDVKKEKRKLIAHCSRVLSAHKHVKVKNLVS